jgi:hypothetical protein
VYLRDFPKGHVPATAIPINHPSFGPVLPGIRDIFTTPTGFWIASVGIIHLSIGVMTYHMGIRKAHNQHPVPTTPRNMSRAVVKDATSHRITLL